MMALYFAGLFALARRLPPEPGARGARRGGAPAPAGEDTGGGTAEGFCWAQTAGAAIVWGSYAAAGTAQARLGIPPPPPPT